MARDAPTHVEIGRADHSIHRANVSVTRVTRNAGECMRSVIEADELRERVDLGPFDRLAGVPRATELRDLGIAGQHVAMAAHAAFDRCDAGERRPTGAAMAQRAVELIGTANVIAMAEIDWLRRRERPAERARNGPACGSDDKQSKRAM